MEILIGVDEAGYGPNIGPLTIACSVWSLNRQSTSAPILDFTNETLSDLSPEFLPKPIAMNGSNKSNHLPLGDSKKIYGAAKGDEGLRSLEAGIRFWLRQTFMRPKSFDQFYSSVAADSQLRTNEIDWYARPTNKLDTDTECWHDLEEDIDTKALQAADQRAKSIGLRLIDLKLTVIDEAYFNRLTQVYGNKATLLSQLSIALASRAIESITDQWLKADSHPIEAIHVLCDKHGGRSKYTAALMQVFPDVWFTAQCESSAISTYEATWKHTDVLCPMTWSFLAKGDSIPIIGFSSMAAKATRQRLMARLNRFWQAKVKGLVATAGYPVDAKRFASEIESAAKMLGISKDMYWRNR